MTYFDATKLYAQFQEKTKDVTESNTNKSNGPRQIELRESGEASLAPDIVKATIICSNVKESMDQAKQSVNRRVDYILQTFRNNRLKEKQYQTHRHLAPNEDGHYKMTAEIVVEFDDFSTYEKTINYLIEKLDKSIEVSKPSFLHSPGKLSDLRRQACLNAVRNCRTKALSIAQFFNQTLGPPLSIREEETLEYTADYGDQRNQDGWSVQQQIDNKTVTVCVKIHVLFECRERTKKPGNR